MLTHTWMLTLTVGHLRLLTCTRLLTLILALAHSHLDTDTYTWILTCTCLLTVGCISLVARTPPLHTNPFSNSHQLTFPLHVVEMPSRLVVEVGLDLPLIFPSARLESTVFVRSVFLIFHTRLPLLSSRFWTSKTAMSHCVGFGFLAVFLSFGLALFFVDGFHSFTFATRSTSCAQRKVKNIDSWICQLTSCQVCLVCPFGSIVLGCDSCQQVVLYSSCPKQTNNEPSNLPNKLNNRAVASREKGKVQIRQRTSSFPDTARSFFVVCFLLATCYIATLPTAISRWAQLEDKNIGLILWICLPAHVQVCVSSARMSAKQHETLQ